MYKWKWQTDSVLLHHTSLTHNMHQQVQSWQSLSINTSQNAMPVLSSDCFPHLWLKLLHFTCAFRAVCQCKLKLKIITAIYFQESVLRLCSRCPCRAPSKPPWRRSAKDQTVLWRFYGNGKTSILCRRQLQLITCYFLKGQPKNTIINWALDLALTSYTHSF